MQITVNYLAVLVAAIASMALGMAWYGPIFGKKWVAYMGWTPEAMTAAQKKGMTKSYIINYVAAFVMAFIIAYFIQLFGITDFSGALMLSLLFWLGFIVTNNVTSVLWEGRPWGLYFINTFYSLVSILVQALILTFWM